MQLVVDGAGRVVGAVGPVGDSGLPDPRELSADLDYVACCRQAGGAAGQLAELLEEALEHRRDPAPRMIEGDLRITVRALHPSGAIATLETERGEKATESLRGLLDQLPIPCIRLDARYRVVSVNRAFESLFGYSAEELVGREPFELIVAAEYVDFVRSIFDLIGAGELEGPSLGENITKDGRRFLSEWTNTRLENEDGSFAGVLSACSDITDRTRMLQQIEHGEQRYRNLIETLPDAILVTRGATLTFVNSAAASLLRAPSSNDLVGKALVDLFHPSSRDILTSDGDLARAYMPQRVQVLALDGEVLPAECVAIPLVDDPGAPGTLVVLRDVALRDALERELQQKQKLEVVGQLASGIAHDFNNVLSIILTACALLSTGRLNEKKMREEIEFIRDAAESAAALVRQLLAFARRRPSEPAWFDLNNLVESSGSLMRRLIGEDVELSVRPAANLWWARADPRQIEQVIVNLVTNARAAMPHGGQLVISTRNVEAPGDAPQAGLEPGRYVELSVADSGSGMDAETLARIFEPFFTTKRQGVGLGLATSEAIVTQAGGLISAESELHRGTIFRVYLPASERAGESSDAAEEVSAVSSRDATILVVDDNLSLRSLTARILRQAGYRVLEARNGSHALDVSRSSEGPIHLLITDVVMPGLSGPELAQKLTAERPDLSVLYISGHADDFLERYGSTIAAEALIQKPFVPRRLLERVSAALATGSPSPGESSER